MRSLWISLLAWWMLGAVVECSAHPIRHYGLHRRVSRKLSGQVIDLTNNHGKDNRIWSPALCQRRDLYVYLPPNFDPEKKYPLIIWLHGFGQDEVSFLELVVEPFDRAIAKGCFPPVILAAPDGTLNGRMCQINAGSFYANNNAGRYGDYLMHDVWGFLHEQFPIRPEREAHALIGASMGGNAAYANGFRYPDRVKNLLGIFPPLNTRYVNCRGRYMANFDPCCWKYRADFNRNRLQVVGRFYLVFTFRMYQMVRPLYGRDPDVTQKVSRNNPIEMLDYHNVKPGDFDMFVAYGGRDQFNLDAQIESFLHVAKQRGLHVDVRYDPKGKHDVRTALSFIPDSLKWLAERLWPYAP